MNEGYLALNLVRDGGGRTRLAGRRQCYPLTTTAVLPIEDEDGALIYVQNAAGSIFGGDRLTMDITVGPKAHLCLSTPAATRLQGGTLSIQETSISVAEGGFIESIPDFLIPHAGARHRQVTRLSLDRNAGAILIDTIAPGRVARGEWHDYTFVSYRLIATVEGREILIDAASFAPEEAPSSLAGTLGGEGYVGTLFALGPQTDYAPLAKELSECLEHMPGVFAGAAPLVSGYGAVARFLANDAPRLREATHSAWDTARTHLRDRPARILRK
ncbi:urease accessory protein UreD [Paracoccus nototheniae]|uniref:Urease accessory protein UreD n=1 Tax=Paracoccus nototheniae TaxID=2489002 RepID=A0ABW4E2P3_9RHOB|nr:urease accessory protein UreD [Paracoccus nototheniae]